MKVIIYMMKEVVYDLLPTISGLFLGAGIGNLLANGNHQLGWRFVYLGILLFALMIITRIIKHRKP